MKNSLKILMLATALSYPLGAQANHHEVKEHAGHAEHQASLHGRSTVTGTGTIHSVSRMNRAVNLTHAPIPALGWPEMTMDLPVAEGVELKDIAPGDDVRFQLQLGDDKVYRITGFTKTDEGHQDTDHGGMHDDTESHENPSHHDEGGHDSVPDGSSGHHGNHDH